MQGTFQDGPSLIHMAPFHLVGVASRDYFSSLWFMLWHVPKAQLFQTQFLLLFNQTDIFFFLKGWYMAMLRAYFRLCLEITLVGLGGPYTVSEIEAEQAT